MTAGITHIIRLLTALCNRTTDKYVLHMSLERRVLLILQTLICHLRQKKLFSTFQKLSKRILLITFSKYQKHSLLYIFFFEMYCLQMICLIKWLQASYLLHFHTFKFIRRFHFERPKPPVSSRKHRFG